MIILQLSDYYPEVYRLDDATGVALVTGRVEWWSGGVVE
jgi:hypothetical protein